VRSRGAREIPFSIDNLSAFTTALISGSVQIRIMATLNQRCPVQPNPALARQIEQGAPADLFISADEAGMDALEKQGLILKETRKSRLSNSLVIVVAADSRLRILSARDLAGKQVERIALADPQSVPAGIYSRKYLEKLKLWPAVARKVVPTENVRAALLLVARGEAPLGIVYLTDAAAEPGVRIVGTFPPDSHPPIVYPMALTRAAGPEAPAFAAYLRGPAARALFEGQGFSVLDRAR